VHEPKGGGRKAISKYCHSINRDKMWIVDVKNLIGKYVRNWKHATVVCFTALSGKLAGGSEKNHNENPVIITVGLPAWIKIRQSKSRHFRLLGYDVLHTGLQGPSLNQAAWRHVQRDKNSHQPCLKKFESRIFTLQDGLQSSEFQYTADYRSFVFSGLFREIIPTLSHIAHASVPLLKVN
jgi:hypothetical protein